MPTLLDDRLVADALTALTDWSGDSQRIRRTVSLDGDKTDGLLAEVQEAADALNHHPEVERSGSDVTFTLRTHSENGVTEYDIALASRIDDLILRASGEGVAVGAPTEAGEGTGETGFGQRQGGGTREDRHVPSTAAETFERGDSLQPSDADHAGPLAGARSGLRDSPGVPLPDTAPNEPQPGLGRPEGQGTPPAGQNVDEGSDRGGPGDPA